MGLGHAWRAWASGCIRGHWQGVSVLRGLARPWGLGKRGVRGPPAVYVGRVKEKWVFTFAGLSSA